MKFKNTELGKEDLNEFLKVVDTCTKDVWLISTEGDRFNLKSIFSRYMAIGELLGECGENLELFCDAKEDEVRFIEYFTKHPEVLSNK